MTFSPRIVPVKCAYRHVGNPRFPVDKNPVYQAAIRHSMGTDKVWATITKPMF
jgi:hypothetical protein